MRSVLVLLASLSPAVALAQYEELENPGTVAAVQERMFRMGHELTLGGGILPLDAFTKSVYAQVSYVAHFSDSFAWQVGRGAYMQGLQTGLREQLEREFEVLPTRFDEVDWMVGSDLLWTPFYGKATVLNRSVLHLEAFLMLGATVLHMKSGAFRPGVNAGLGLRFFHTKVLSYRLDVTNNFVLGRPLDNIMTLQLMVALNFGAP